VSARLVPSAGRAGTGAGPLPDTAAVKVTIPAAARQKLPCGTAGDFKSPLQVRLRFLVVATGPVAPVRWVPGLPGHW
jgi:hypothetical protein